MNLKFWQRQPKKSTINISASSYNTADSTRHNRAAWAKATGLTAADANSSTVRGRIRSRARYEVANNTHARAITIMLGNDVVGRGPTLQVNDDARAPEIEAAWTAWVDAVRLWSTLRQIRSTRAEDGESFSVFAKSTPIFGVKFRLTPMETERVTGLGQTTETYNDGITYNSYGEPTSYSFVGGLGATPKKIAAEHVVHYFKCDRPGQLRGISELTPALDLFEQLRQFTFSALLASKRAADTTGFIKVPSNLEDIGSDVTAISSEPGTYKFISDAMEVVDTKNNYPVTNFGDFRHCILQDAFRAVNMPYNVAAADSSEHNYASGRLDDQAYRRAIEIDQQDMELGVLGRTFARWFAEAYGGELPRVSWFWPQRAHIDPSKEEKAVQMRLDSMTSTRERECALKGLDYKDVFAQLEIERDLLLDAGLLVDDEILDEGI